MLYVEIFTIIINFKDIYKMERIQKEELYIITV